MGEGPDYGIHHLLTPEGTCGKGRWTVARIEQAGTAMLNSMESTSLK